MLADPLGSSPHRTASGGPAAAMGRTRLGLLAGAARAFADQGPRRSTMQSVAAAAGVAKATLYNHFRTKDEVARALLALELDRLSATAAALPTGPGAGRARPTSSARIRCSAGWPSPSPRCSPALLGTDRWAELTGRLAAALRVDEDGAELAGRWLLGVVLQPGRSTARHRHAARLAAALGAAQPRASERVRTTRSAPGPAWSRERCVLAPRAAWNASAAAFSGRATACTTRAPVDTASSSNQRESRAPSPARRRSARTASRWR